MIKHNYTGEVKTNVDAIIAECAANKITNEYAIIAILAVAGEESGFIPKSENLNYSKERLPEVWGIFSKTGMAVKAGQGKFNYNKLAEQCEHNPQKLGDLVYGKHGGYKYRGRGYGQLTFDYNYKNFAKIIGVDILNNPDLVNTPAIAAKIHVAFALNGLKQKGIDINSYTDQMTALIDISRVNAGQTNVEGKKYFITQQEYVKKFTIV